MTLSFTINLKILQVICLNVIPEFVFPFCLSLIGLELLYQPEVVRLYLSLLTYSHNHNTLEAAAGALQNLAAGHWAVSERQSDSFLHS